MRSAIWRPFVSSRSATQTSRLPRKGFRERRANPRRSAGDERGFVFKTKHGKSFRRWFGKVAFVRFHSRLE